MYVTKKCVREIPTLISSAVRTKLKIKIKSVCIIFNNSNSVLAVLNLQDFILSFGCYSLKYFLECFVFAATIVNVTILNGMGVSGTVSGSPTWHPYSPHMGHYLDIAVTYSQHIWPWAGWIAIHMTVR